MKAFNRIDEFFNSFKKTDLWKKMLLTREDSPWHREENVAEHTRMVVEWYRTNIAANRNDKQHVLTCISAIFHDVGKPMAEVRKESAERGKYRSYTSHELLSARIWTDYAIKNFSGMSTLLGINASDVSTIAFFIEHHLPFDMVNVHKRAALKKSLILRSGEPGHQAWKDLLCSDQFGRISDDSEIKLKNFQNWLTDWDNS